MSHRGLSLLELLLAVIVVGLLATVAVSNLQSAATRAKISRVQADFRSIETAVEAYRVDAGSYPSTNEMGTTPTVLSSPVAYLSNSGLKDPLYKPELHGDPNLQNLLYRYNCWAEGDPSDLYVNYHLKHFGDYWMYSNHPFAGGGLQIIQDEPRVTTLVAYNATNGTVSAGRLVNAPLY